ncbi:NUDIX hydrolase [Streptomyces sp. NPDC019224]|uniref:NUDIX hydrolase n=1 Tax=Streptomyces sp. NPDC019224 TaxID=3154484 RepID=UPI0033F91F80
MQWKIHGERPIYENSWVNLWLTDVETPDGNRWEHRVVKLRHLAVAAVVNERREVLMMWRHRAAVKPLFYAEPANGITDSQHHVFRADGATYEGPPTDVRGMIDRREIVSSGSLVGLLYVLMDEVIR